MNGKALTFMPRNPERTTVRNRAGTMTLEQVRACAPGAVAPNVVQFRRQEAS
jgi:hypothetical protein